MVLEIKHLLIAYFLSSMFVKSHLNRFMYVQVISQAKGACD